MFCDSELRDAKMVGRSDGDAEASEERPSDEWIQRNERYLMELGTVVQGGYIKLRCAARERPLDSTTI